MAPQLHACRDVVDKFPDPADAAKVAAGRDPVRAREADIGQDRLEIGIPRRQEVMQDADPDARADRFDLPPAR